MSRILAVVLTAENHRHIQPGCDCKWEQPWPGEPWVLTIPSPRCRYTDHRTLSRHAGHQKYWEMTLHAVERRIGELKPLAATARTQLTKLGGATQ